MSTIVTRFAPSPTGYLHVGGARTALFSWLLARHHGSAGRFLLRIEDTDLARSTEQATTQLLEDLRWLGLQWDNKQLVYQSKRQHVYNAIIDDLIARGLAYKAYETRAEIDAMRKEAERAKKPFVYRRDPAARATSGADDRPHVVRFATPIKEHRFHDVIYGKEIVQPIEEIQDFIIRKEDGMPTYHFAVVVDDAEMKITHILRGQEHTKNTFNHIAIQEALSYPRPIYGHLPVIDNMEGKKMGERDRDKKIREAAQLWVKNGQKSAAELASVASIEVARVEEWLKNSKTQLDIPEQAAVIAAIGLKESELPEILVHDFRKNGYLPETLLNFLALLGWSPGGDRERMSMEEMVQLFSIEGINKSSARFDRAKLLAFNTEAAAGAAPARLVAAMRDYLSVNPDSPLRKASDAQLGAVLEMKKGFRLLREVEESARFLFIADDAIQYDAAAIEKVLKKNDGEGLKVLRDVRDILSNAGDWTAASLEHAIQQYCEQQQLGLGKVAQPLRVAVSGSTISPPIFQSLEFLGKGQTLRRMERCLAMAV